MAWTNEAAGNPFSGPKASRRPSRKRSRGPLSLPTQTLSSLRGEQHPDRGRIRGIDQRWIFRPPGRRKPQLVVHRHPEIAGMVRTQRHRPFGPGRRSGGPDRFAVRRKSGDGRVLCEPNVAQRILANRSKDAGHDALLPRHQQKSRRLQAVEAATGRCQPDIPLVVLANVPDLGKGKLHCFAVPGLPSPDSPFRQGYPKRSIVCLVEHAGPGCRRPGEARRRPAPTDPPQVDRSDSRSPSTRHPFPTSPGPAGPRRRRQRPRGRRRDNVPHLRPGSRADDALRIPRKMGFP